MNETRRTTRRHQRQNRARPTKKPIRGDRADHGPNGTLDPSSRSERGSALVEAAFVTPLLIMLLVGTVTASMAYSQHTSLQTASREASRYAASLPVSGNLDSWLRNVLDVARNAAAGDLDPNVAGQYICVAYVYPAGTAVNDRTTRLIQSVGVTGVPLASPAARCFDDGRPDNERRVQVVTQRAATIQAVMFSADVNLSSPSVAKFERGDS